MYSLTMDVPRAEICCEVGKIFLEESCPDRLPTGTGRRLLCLQIRKRVDFLWLSIMGLCHICSFAFVMIKWDVRAGILFHKKAMELKPEDSGVLYDQKYFRENMVWHKKKDIFIIFSWQGTGLRGSYAQVKAVVIYCRESYFPMR